MSTSTARDELYDLADEASEQVPQHSSVKDDVREAIQDYALEQQRAQEEAEANERQRQIQLRQQAEKEELQASSQAVVSALKEEMEKDQDFAKLVKSNDLPASLVENIAEVADADEAGLIVRELAGNEEFQESLKRAKTVMGQKRIIGKIRKEVLTGGSRKPSIPKMMEKSVPQYNPNNSYSTYDEDYYSDVAMRHGI
ncbi:MAG: hypothetical protein CL833_05895 [Crocinitomicaceae bacterium]|nr:hypothetical protein [Crocinitomicaceae bacterium]